MILARVARQRHQPGLSLRGDHWLLVRPRSVIERRQLGTALNRLMMGPTLRPSTNGPPTKETPTQGHVTFVLATSLLRSSTAIGLFPLATAGR